MRTFAAFILLLLLPAFAYAFCFEEAGATYGVSPLLLWSIAKHESNMNPRAVGRNSNGTYGYGLMRINSSWAKVLGKACSLESTIIGVLRQLYAYTKNQSEKSGKPISL